MADRALVAGIAAMIGTVFHGEELFSCLTGSTAAGIAHAASDIDLLVVLPDHTPLSEARAARERFTRCYVDLHRSHHRTPDLDWPGEVLYARDLHAAVLGGAFTLSGPHGDLLLCSLDEPYRYWISMIATGVPTSKPGAFARAAHQCATTITHHVLHSATRGCPDALPPSTVSTHPAWDDWHVTARHIQPGTLLSSQLRADLHACHCRGAGYLTLWRAQMRAPQAPPPLEEWATAWRCLARTAMESPRPPR